MQQRYNFALLSTGHPERYITAAEHHFQHLADGYLLGSESLPHITLAQFRADPEVLPALITALALVPHIIPIHLSGLGFSNKADTPLWGASLTVARSSNLLTLHQTVVHILAQHTLSPLNATGDLYRPHLTLARIHRLDVHDFKKDIFEGDTFRLALGLSDELGQFKRVLHQF
ncbi:MAG: 2'-5' RNA ligase family protein [Candidatus Nucleicultricaceae bacterium]